VITIIAILIALLLPAVQAAREAARQIQCKDHLKQLALACLSHENATGRYPTDGWGYGWTGDADRGNDWRQPGGWMYNILPYIEEQPMHDLGAGMPTAQKYAAHLQRMSTPLTVLYCPTRRPAIAYPWSTTVNPGGGQLNCGVTPTVVGRNDYAGNEGTNYTFVGYHPQIDNSPQRLSGEYSEMWYAQGPPNITAFENPPGTPTPAAYASMANVASEAFGVIFYASMIRPRDVTDGTTNTYLVGEKLLNPDHYTDGEGTSDNEDAMMGDDDDTVQCNCNMYYPNLLSTQNPALICPNPFPLNQDTPGIMARGFGSAHSNGCNMAFCDGRVDLMSYNTNFLVQLFLACRNDGRLIGSKKMGY